MISAELDAYLRSVRKEAAAIMELEDINDESLLNDATLRSSTRVAFSQVKSFLRRPLHRIERGEVYAEVKDCVRLKNTPIDTAATFEVSEFTTGSVIDPASYIIDNSGFLQFKYSSGYVPFNVGPNDDLNSEYMQIKVRYTGGYGALEDEYEIHEAIVTQSIASYNRRNMHGVSIGGTAESQFSVASDRGSLVQSARDMLSAFVYYGSCRDVGV